MSTTTKIGDEMEFTERFMLSNGVAEMQKHDVCPVAELLESTRQLLLEGIQEPFSDPGSERVSNLCILRPVGKPRAELPLECAVPIPAPRPEFNPTLASGITLRDEVAMRALQGTCASPIQSQVPVVSEAYTIAAMFLERRAEVLGISTEGDPAP